MKVMNLPVGEIRTVSVKYLPKPETGSGPCKRMLPEIKWVAVQDVVLIAPVKEQVMEVSHLGKSLICKFLCGFLKDHGGRKNLCL